MKKIATLGPRGTFSDAATSRYIHSCSENFEVVYYNSIKKALCSIGDQCEIGILPIENLTEGFISVVLDHLVEADLHISGEIFHDISFSFLSNRPNISKIDRMYVQYVAKGQCTEFISSLGELEIVHTESNIESLELLIAEGGNSAAIVPSGSFEPENFSLVTNNIDDYEHNQTRFLVFSSEFKAALNANAPVKTSMVVLDDDDHPGLLSEVLNPLANRGINLTTIISRPTGKMFGRYYIFIDFDGDINDSEVQIALQEIQGFSSIKIFGSYQRVV